MRRKTDKLAVVCTAVCILCLAIMVVVSGTVVDTKSQADEATDTTAQIQRERARNIRSSCQAQNKRHDDSVDTLNRVVLERLTGKPAPIVMTSAEIKIRLAAALKLADPPVRKQVQQSVGSTTLLIEALAPKRQCDDLVRQQVDTKNP